MKKNIVSDEIALERSAFLSGAAPRDDELPQVETIDDVMANLLHDYTGKPLSEVEAIMPKHYTTPRG